LEKNLFSAILIVFFIGLVQVWKYIIPNDLAKAAFYGAKINGIFASYLNEIVGTNVRTENVENMECSQNIKKKAKSTKWALSMIQDFSTIRILNFLFCDNRIIERRNFFSSLNSKKVLVNNTVTKFSQSLID
jgi:hypothetical protein